MPRSHVLLVDGASCFAVAARCSHLSWCTARISLVVFAPFCARADDTMLDATGYSFAHFNAGT